MQADDDLDQGGDRDSDDGGFDPNAEGDRPEEQHQETGEKYQIGEILHFYRIQLDVVDENREDPRGEKQRLLKNC